MHNKNPKISKIADDIVKWLGEGAIMKYNKAGDPYFMSKDGLRKIRWDWNKTSPHDYKHLHFEVLENGKWKDAVRGKSQIGKWYIVK